MNTAGKITILGLVGVGLFAAGKALTATKTMDAAEKLVTDINGIKIKEILKSGLFPIGVIYTINLQINNPSETDIEISKLFITLSAKTKTGLARIANTSVPSGEIKNIKGNSKTLLSQDIEIRFANVAGIIPDFAGYIVGRLRGSKSTQQIIADVSVDALGLTIPTRQVINL